MSIDPGRIGQKAAYILEQVGALRDLGRRLPKEQILHDPWTYRGVKYSLQTAIEAVIDLAYHVSTKKYAHAPTDARDALRTLRDQGLIGETDLEVYLAMVGLRNRIVHGYQEIDPERIYEILTRDLGDLERFAGQITALLK